MPLAVLREKVAIIPLLASAAALEGYLRAFETVVLIKVRGALDYVRPAVAANHATACYAERLGTPAEYLTTNLADPGGARAAVFFHPYFEELAMQLSVIGIGPGSDAYLVPAARRALADADIVIGYHYYFPVHYPPAQARLREPGPRAVGGEARAELAVDSCQPGTHVAVISSGDAGIYAMASLVYEYAARRQRTVFSCKPSPASVLFRRRRPGWARPSATISAARRSPI
ncbi:MAG: SAM-dependent methyltransferase [Hymenobacter sp.]